MLTIISQTINIQYNIVLQKEDNIDTIKKYILQTYIKDNKKLLRYNNIKLLYNNIELTSESDVPKNGIIHLIIVPIICNKHLS